jgi:hypothetical protein
MKMKSFNIIEDNNDITVYLGTTAEIKAIYNSLWRAINNYHSFKTNLMFTFVDKAKFSHNKFFYGLVIDHGREEVNVISAETAVNLMLLSTEEVTIR